MASTNRRVEIHTVSKQLDDLYLPLLDSLAKGDDVNLATVSLYSRVNPRPSPYHQNNQHVGLPMVGDYLEAVSFDPNKDVRVLSFTTVTEPVEWNFYFNGSFSTGAGTPAGEKVELIWAVNELANGFIESLMQTPPDEMFTIPAKICLRDAVKAIRAVGETVLTCDGLRQGRTPIRGNELPTHYKVVKTLSGLHVINQHMGKTIIHSIAAGTSLFMRTLQAVDDGVRLAELGLHHRRVGRISAYRVSSACIEVIPHGDYEEALPHHPGLGVKVHSFTTLRSPVEWNFYCEDNRSGVLLRNQETPTVLDTFTTIRGLAYEFSLAHLDHPENEEPLIPAVTKLVEVLEAIQVIGEKVKKRHGTVQLARRPLSDDIEPTDLMDSMVQQIINAPVPDPMVQLLNVHTDDLFIRLKEMYAIAGWSANVIGHVVSLIEAVHPDERRGVILAGIQKMREDAKKFY
jgi:hypothetical protein